MKVRVRGISYSFKKWGDSSDHPPLVLLHGFMGSGATFEELIRHCSTFSTPYTIDLLGHGDTEGSEMHYRFSTKEQVADLKKLISEQIGSPVFLYGYSMGARLALALALAHPELIQGLILESGSFGIENDTERQARQALDGQRADDITGNFDSFLKDWKEMPLLKTNKKHPELDAIQSQQDPYWMANSLMGFGTGTMPCQRDSLEEFRNPVQLITGERDSKFIRINQTMKKDLKDADLEIVENAGHRVHLDQPEEISNILNQFIHKNIAS